MIYSQLLPSPGLVPYIDAYWTVTGKHTNNTKAEAQKIMPDGCVDIIFNLGEDFLTDDNSFLMKNRHAYLVGTMTRYKSILRASDTHLIGIRFKPAAFSIFFKHSSLHEIVDKTIEFDKRSAPEVNADTNELAGYLNRFFIDRLSLSNSRQPLAAVIADVNNLKGVVTVEALAKRHFISQRQLERFFKFHIGTSPKEFINFVRYQSALRRIRNNPSKKSLLDIAFDSGYYDHSHLSNEIRKYTGCTPSEL